MDNKNNYFAVPKHVAIIMDGNGRWAQSRAHERVWGHVRGSAIVTEIVEEALNLKLDSLTLYAFSTENWSRPYLEVTTLFKLLKKFLNKERNKILSNQIRFRVMGDISRLPSETQKLIKDLEDSTRDFNGLKLTFAFNYGGRKEIIDAINSFIVKNPNKLITEDQLQKYLYQPELKEIDLLIRTGGDQRVSNFLIWQIAYSELYFTETQRPDFGANEFRKIIQYVSQRERRFGTIGRLRWSFCLQEN